MKTLGSLVIAVLVGVVAVWLLVKLVFITLKLVGILIGVGLAVAVFLVIERMIRGSGHA